MLPFFTTDLDDETVRILADEMLPQHTKLVRSLNLDAAGNSIISYRVDLKPHYNAGVRYPHLATFFKAFTDRATADEVLTRIHKRAQIAEEREREAAYREAGYPPAEAKRMAQEPV